MLRCGRLSSERGAVAVLVGLMLPAIALLLAFVIDMGNWWTHKRHLQTQADAGALAGGQGPWLPACDEAAIEQAAFDYAGAMYNGQYQPSGSVGTVLNSTDYADKGGSNFSDGSGTPCQSLAAGNGHLDVKTTEAGLSNFFGSIPGFSSVTVHSHARVEVQGALQEPGVRPLAVADTALYKRAYADLYVHGGKSLIATIPLGFRTVQPDSSTQFTGNGTVSLPNENVDVRIRLGNDSCSAPADTDNCDTFGDLNGGLNFINVFAGGSPNGGEPPKIHSVSIPPGGGCAPDPYFSTNSCAALVKAYVDFASGATTSGSGQNAFVTINGVDATSGSDSDGLYWTASIPIAAGSGLHEMTVDWRQEYGKIGSGKKAQDCAKKTCSGSFGVQQAAFSATEDDTTYDPTSGKIELVQIGEVGKSTLGANSFPQGSSHDLRITVQVKGLWNSAPGDPPTTMRAASPQSNGLIDCVDGNSGVPTASGAMQTGCPRPIYIWPDGTSCVDASNSGSPTPIDCVEPVPGHKSNDITRPIAARIGGTCNNWNAYRDSGTPIPVADPRRITLIIVEPPLKKHGDMEVRNLASFYVTGVYNEPGAKNPTGCENDAAGKYQVVGHWIKFVPTGGGVGTGKGCDVSKFGDCVAVLTQ